MNGERSRADRASTNRRTLVTGAAGFVGRWLVPRLQDGGDDVIGVRHPAEAEAPLPIQWLPVDLGESEAVQDVVRDTGPDCIVHLAAIAFPPEAERDPTEALRVNYGAVDSLLVGMARFAPRARLLYVSTGAAYGPGPADRAPFEEKDPLLPDSLYTATKTAAEQRCVLAVEREELDVVRVRPFNHTGPGRPPDYVESAFTHQLVQIERGEQEPVLRVGALDSIRDFSDVRDVVGAYTLLLDRGERGGVYNICSGRGRSVQELLDTLLTLTPVQPRVERDPSRYRPSPPDRLSLVGNPGRVRALGWEPRYVLEETLRDLFEDWRSRASTGSP
jgi:GDP-4-dehydro-6-deoxy-D-mannose reductase